MHSTPPSAPTTLSTNFCSAIKLVVLSAAIVLLAAGCIRSLHPLFTAQDLVFDPALLGTWTEPNSSSETWVFEKAGDKSYRLVYTESGDTGEFTVHLLKLGSARFLDFYPDEAGFKETKRNDFYKSHFLPVHMFFKVMQIQPVLQMASLDPDWLKKHLEANPNAIAHQKLGDEIVLTAPTRELQQFVLKHLQTDAAWGEPSKLERKGAPGQSKP